MQTLEKYRINYYNDSRGAVPRISFQRAGMPVYIMSSFLCGSRFDVIPGTAHFLEHMLVAGTKKYPSKKQLSGALEELGGVFGAYTQQDFLRIIIDIAGQEDLSAGLDILNEIVNNSLFDTHVIENERGAILSEHYAKQSNPQLSVWEVYRRLFFQGTDYGRSIIGTEESIKTITPQDIADYYHNVFLKAPVFVTAAGDFEHTDLEGKSDAIFNRKVSPDSLHTLESLPVIREKKIDLEVYGGQNASIIFGFRTDSFSRVNVPHLDILLNYLAMGRSSVLVEELRYKKGLVYSVGGYNYYSLGLGAWSISTNFNTNHTQEVIALIIGEIKKILTDGLREEELTFVKNKMIKSNPRKMQTAEDWVTNHSSIAFLANPDQYLVTNYEQSIMSASAESILNTARKYFTKDNWYLAMCGPESLKNITIDF